MSSLGKRTKRAKTLKARGDDLWRDMASERVSSRASLRALEASLGKQWRFTCTLKLEISCSLLNFLLKLVLFSFWGLEHEGVEGLSGCASRSRAPGNGCREYHASPSARRNQGSEESRRELHGSFDPAPRVVVSVSRSRRSAPLPNNRVLVIVYLGAARN